MLAREAERLGDDCFRHNDMAGHLMACTEPQDTRNGESMNLAGMSGGRMEAIDGEMLGHDEE